MSIKSKSNVKHFASALYNVLFSDQELVSEGNSTHDNVCQFSVQLAERRQEMFFQQQMRIIQERMVKTQVTLQRVLRNVFSWFNRS